MFLNKGMNSKYSNSIILLGGKEGTIRTGRERQRRKGGKKIKIKIIDKGGKSNIMKTKCRLCRERYSGFQNLENLFNPWDWD